MDRSWVVVLVLVVGGVVVSCGGDEEEAGRPVQERARRSVVAPFALVDRTVGSGLEWEVRSGSRAQKYIVEVKSTGVGVLDYDGDGRMDVVLTAGSTIERMRKGEPGFGTRLFRNQGGFRFVDVTEEAGIPKTGWACAPVAADYDGDGDTDLYITQIGRNLLLRNDGGRFVDVTEAAGVAGDEWSTSAVFHDIDGDGDLDLYVADYLEFPFDDPPVNGKGGWNCTWKGFEVMCGPKGFKPQRDRCYRNDGGGTFTDVSEEWGLGELEPAYGLGVLAGDLDHDGKTEIYVANDSTDNFWLDWTGKGFEDDALGLGVSCGEGGSSQAGMGVDAADLNFDGRADLVCTNFSGEVNNLYISTTGGVYEDASASRGTALTNLHTLGWGCAFEDFNLDGRMDLFIANGHVYPQAARAGTNTDYPQFNTLFLGKKGGGFEAFQDRESDALRVKKVSRGCAVADFDNDGDMDLLVCNLNDIPTLIETVVHRQKKPPRSLTLRLVGPEGARDAIGARVTVVSTMRSQTREVRRQRSFQASCDPRIVVAFLPDETPEKINVRWPDGKMETFPIPKERAVILEHGKGLR